VFGGILVLAALLFFLPVGRRVIHTSDEARFGILAQDIVEEGRWVLPRLRGGVYLNKPPLYFWSIALISLPFGRVTEFTAQLPSAIAALFGVLGVGLIGTKLWGRAAGVAAALILATSAGYFYSAHLVLPDMMLTAWMIWALLFLVHALEEWPKQVWLLGFYACVGGAVATKGPVGLLPLLPAAMLLFVEKGRRGFDVRSHVFGLLILGASVAVWLLPYLFQEEKSYTQTVVKGNYLGWFFRSAESVSSRLVPLFSLLAGFLPWTPFLLASLWERRAEPEIWRRNRKWIVVWTLMLFVVIGLSGEQRTRYLIPVYPGVALLVAHAMTRWSLGKSSSRLQWGMIGWGAIAIGCSAALIFGTFSLLRPAVLVFLPETTFQRWVVALFLLVGGVGGIVATYLNRSRAVLPLVGLTTAAILALTAATYPVRQSATFDVKQVAQRFTRHLEAESMVAFYRYSNLSFDFYLKRPLQEFQTFEQAHAFMARPSPAFLLLEDKEWNAISDRAPATWRMIDDASISARRLLLVRNQ
jgi:4-amino-4-deoxy-L-arabinose transferase-like glycosyltransferase